MKFKTDNKEIIELFEIYQYTRYYYFNIIKDIIDNVDFETEKINNIMSYLNEIELNNYINCLRIHLKYTSIPVYTPDPLPLYIPNQQNPLGIYMHFIIEDPVYKYIKADIKKLLKYEDFK